MKKTKQYDSNPVRVILLNGVSSSGKTSIAKELQKLLEPTYLHLELDMFINVFPDDYNNIKDENLRAERRGNVLSVMNHCINSIVKNGYNLIIDHVLDDSNSMPKIISELSGFNVVSIGIFCSLEVLEKREITRGDRKIGLARSQYQQVHFNKRYDFEIDASFTNPNECAYKIMEYISGYESG